MLLRFALDVPGEDVAQEALVQVPVVDCRGTKSRDSHSYVVYSLRC